MYVPSDLVNQYIQLCAETRDQSDISEHLPKLRNLARRCRHVTEFGVCEGKSTTALLLGVLESGGTLVSYDVHPCEGTRKRLDRYSYKDNGWRFVRGHSLEVDIEPTDMLFIDTIHTGRFVFKELEMHASKVGRFIAMHDTFTYGQKGDDGGEGMVSAVGRFLTIRPSWAVKEVHDNQHGLTVLERVGDAAVQS